VDICDIEEQNDNSTEFTAAAAAAASTAKGKQYTSYMNENSSCICQPN